VHGKPFFESVGDALSNFLAPSLRGFSRYYTSHNLKLWYGDVREEHYEVQRISERAFRGKASLKGPLLEIGFHTEHKDRARNDDVIERLTAAEKKWRRKLGPEVEVGPFIGYQSGSWRRISELWENAPLSTEAEIAVEAAERLAAYIQAFEPLRGGQEAARRGRKSR
jgi:hypothetical protein